MTGVAEAQREFLRIVDVTARISESSTCLRRAGLGEWSDEFVDIIMVESKDCRIRCWRDLGATA